VIQISLSAVFRERLREAERVFGPPRLREVMLAGGREAAAVAEAAARQIPAPSGKPLKAVYARRRRDGTVYKSKFKSERQRYKVMGMVAKGLIPYKRTGGLANSMTSTVEALDSAGNGVIVTVGTNKPYARFVIDLPPPGGNQSRYHDGTWTPLRTQIEGERAQIGAAFEVGVRTAINRLLRAR
jgi:hypothetical protein